LFASPEVLFSLKRSHINFPIRFNKHIEDYTLLYNHFDGIDYLDDITKINFKETEDRLGKLKTPSLNKSVEEFFGQSNGYVKSYFVHDDIHKAMAHYHKPLYEMMQVDKNLAKCEKDMWNLFTFEDKCKCVLEEAYVIALERRIIPMIFGGGKGYTSEEALDWALMRICTTLCSGWFRKFATNNYYGIKKLVNKNYVEKFLTEYENGNITRQTSN
jgi:galactose-1-phosphate uridylyltransferase